MSYAGRVTGGDLKFPFNNAVDDASYAVNTALKAALTGYKTKLVSVQGDGTSNGGGDTTIVDTTHVDTTGNVIHNFTLSGKTSTFFTITGNLSTSYGTATYAGLTLTQCLKMESSTNISFTTTKAGTLTLICGSSYSASIKIDGNLVSPTSGVISIPLAAGAHTILKGSGSNYLFYMAIAYLNTGVVTAINNHAIAFPNPFKNILSINSALNLNKIEIYNLAGKLLISTDGTQKDLDLNDLNQGVYLLRIQSEEGNFNQMIMKQ
jgi:hypothetical protein